MAKGAFIMLVSVITRAFNRLEYTAQCISSAKLNMGMEFEHIIVDNGSTDGTREWLDCIVKNPWFSHLRVFHLERNLGDFGGMRFGVEQAKGKYVMQMDNDALLLQDNTMPRMIETLEFLKCQNVMLFREDMPLRVRVAPPHNEFIIKATGIHVVEVVFPVCCYVLSKDDFMKAAADPATKVCDHLGRFGKTFKILNMKCREIDAWDPVTKKYLQYEKYPQAIYHESY